MVFFEDKMMFKMKGPVPAGGVHHSARRGGREARRRRYHSRRDQQDGAGGARGCGSCWQQTGISAEVIDPRTTVPLDKQTLIASAKKTGRAIVIDEGYERYGVTAELAAVIAEGAFYDLDAPGQAHGGDGRAGSILAGAGRSDRTDAGICTLPGRARKLCAAANLHEQGRDHGTEDYGLMAVDWEERVDVERLRTERLARAKMLLREVRDSARCSAST